VDDSQVDLERESWVRRALFWLAIGGAAIGFLNFWLSAAESLSVGDATIGYVQDGHYFLGFKGPRYNEVSPAEWEWNRFHHSTGLPGTAMLMTAALYLNRRYSVRPHATARRRSEVEAEALAIRASGEPLAQARSAGVVGNTGWRLPLISVSVYPAGMVIKPFLAAPVAIPAPSIRLWWDKPGSEFRLLIDHTAPGIESPMRLEIEPGETIAIAIGMIAGSGPSSEQATAPADQAADTDGPPPGQSRHPIDAAAFVLFGVVTAGTLAFDPYDGGMSWALVAWKAVVVVAFAAAVWLYFRRGISAFTPR
jgi:hypothetical protein